MSDFVESVRSALTDSIALKALKKSLEKAMIRTVYAPILLMEKEANLNTQSLKATMTVKDGQKELADILGQLDTGIQGKGRQAIEETVANEIKNYDDL